jgi:3-demethoxyubiquinol 3-hydroxylase
MDLSKLHEPAVATTPHNMTREQREILDIALRVDQAGEVAANWIYKGQMAVLGRDPTVGPIIQV